MAAKREKRKEKRRKKKEEQRRKLEEIEAKNKENFELQAAQEKEKHKVEGIFSSRAPNARLQLESCAYLAAPSNPKPITW